MSKQELTKEIVTAAIEAFAKDICVCFKKYSIPPGLTKAQAADTFVRSIALRVTTKQLKSPSTIEQDLVGIAASAFLVEHIDDIVAKVVALECGQTNVIE